MLFRSVITLGDGQSITLDGVHAADLSEANFAFDQTPVLDNAGTMTIGDGAMLPLSGIIENTGTIELDSAGNGTLLELIQYGITLQGGGQVILSDDDNNVISGTLSTVTLTNVDNTIFGAGQLGNGQMTLVNEGTIDATGTHSLVIDTGANVIVNSGTIEANGSGGLIIYSTIENTGLIWANGGNITIDGDVIGSGSAKISGTASLEFGSASSANTTLAADAAGSLILDDSFHFSGTVAGFDGNDYFDLADVLFANGVTLDYAANQDGTGGTLSVSDGAHTASIALLGQYDAAGFQSAADSTSGTLVTYDPNHLV